MTRSTRKDTPQRSSTYERNDAIAREFLVRFEIKNGRDQEIINFYEEVLQQHIDSIFSAIELEVIGKLDMHRDHSEKDEWYTCVKCMDVVHTNNLRKEQRKKLSDIRKRYTSND